MRPDLHPALLSPAERRHAVAELLAIGLLHLHARAALVAPNTVANSPQNLRDSETKSLALLPKALLTIHTGKGSV